MVFCAALKLRLASMAARVSSLTGAGFFLAWDSALAMLSDDQMASEAARLALLVLMRLMTCIRITTQEMMLIAIIITNTPISTGSPLWKTSAKFIMFAFYW